ncbi:hypothetical protein EHM69_01005 [candidate division KSB1 bacterium]|nr:MAG: hypothetical protein EHM69_01005 [candidate division KSB1 bacterium]
MKSTGDVRVVNTRYSLDSVPIVPVFVPLGQPLKEQMFWSAMLSAAKASGEELCCKAEAMLTVAGEG